jgi:hypothetical protein
MRLMVKLENDGGVAVKILAGMVNALPPVLPFVPKTILDDDDTVIVPLVLVMGVLPE